MSWGKFGIKKEKKKSLNAEIKFDIYNYYDLEMCTYTPRLFLSCTNTCELVPGCLKESEGVLCALVRLNVWVAFACMFYFFLFHFQFV